jgi:hypothetical protein
MNGPAVGAFVSKLSSAKASAYDSNSRGCFSTALGRQPPMSSTQSWQSWREALQTMSAQHFRPKARATLAGLTTGGRPWFLPRGLLRRAIVQWNASLSTAMTFPYSRERDCPGVNASAGKVASSVPNRCSSSRGFAAAAPTLHLPPTRRTMSRNQLRKQ